MDKLVKLEDQVICVTGTANNKRWYRRLADENVKTTKSIGKKTTLVIAQDTWGRLCTEARLKGIPIIKEKAGEMLLEEGELTIQVADEEKGASVSTQIAEARSILDGAPSDKMWESLVKLIDGTSSEQLKELVDYLDPLVSRWESHPSDLAELRGQVNSDYTFWNDSVLPGDFRVMPPSWASESMSGEPSEKLRLVRAIVMAQVPFKLTGLKKMLGSEHLTNLHTLAFGGRSSPRLSASFYKNLPRLEGTKNLETLILNSWNEKSLATLDAWANWSSVHTLGFVGHGDSALIQHPDEKHMNTLYRSDFAKQIKTLHVDTGHSVGYFDYGIAHLGDDGLPNLERLQVHSYSNAYFKNSVERAALMPREIPTLALMGTIKTLEDRAFESLVAVEVPQCHTLDLASLSMVLRSGWHYILGIEDADEEPSYKQGRTMVLDAFRNQFASHFKDSPLARSISAVRLGALLYSDEFAERLSDAGVEVTQ